MTSRAGLTPERVVEAALAIVDEAGLEGLTLAKVAQRTNVATPSLYKYVAGLPALRRLLRLRVLTEFDHTLREALVGRSGEAALRALATAYRDYLRRHPHRAGLLETAPGDDPSLQAVSDRVVELAYTVVRGYGVTGTMAVHAVRCLRAAVHGFAQLEALGGFGLPAPVDVTFGHLVDMLHRQLTQLARPHPPPADEEAGPTTA